MKSNRARSSQYDADGRPGDPFGQRRKEGGEGRSGTPADGGRPQGDDRDDRADRDAGLVFL
jgi:hypothetical protein